MAYPSLPSPRSTHSPRLLSLVLALIVGTAACGGGGGTTATSGQGSPASTTGGATQTTSSTGTSTAPATTAQAGGAAEACELLTVEEVAGALGLAAVTADSISGEPSFCTYRDTATSGPVVATSYTTQGADSAFAVWAASSGVTEVSGLGDGAVFDPNSATLFILSGGALLGLTAGDGSMDAGQRQDLAEQLGALAVGRM